MKRIFLLPLFLIFVSALQLQAENPTDSLSGVLPLISSDPVEVKSMFDKLPNGKLPSDYSFAISNPTEEQKEAWLAGNYDELSGIMNVENPEEQTKASFLENTEEAIGKARGVIKKIRETGAFVQTLTGGDLVTLPIGISDTLGQTLVTVGVGHILLFPTYASLEVYVEVFHPGKMENPIFFGAPDVKYSRQGGLSGDVSLGLLGDFKDSIINNKAMIIFKSAVVDPATNEFKQDVGTFAAFSCDGLENMNIDVKVELDTSIAIPVDTTVHRVTGGFELNLDNGFDDVLVAIDFNTPFHHPKKDEVVFDIQDVVFDFSETLNSDLINFSQLTTETGYNPLEFLPEPNNWEGLYIGKIGITWRDSLVNQTDTTQATNLQIEGRQIVIDRNGFTGFIMANPILDIENGSLSGGWAVSIDTLEVQITTNQFTGLYFNGALSVPLFNEDEEGEAQADAESNMRYVADFDFANDFYSFTASFDSTKVLPVKMLHAEVKLFNTSTFTLAYGNDEGVLLSADLTGSFGADGAESEDGKKWDIPTITFQNIVLTNKRPFLQSGGTWGLPSELNIGYNGYGLTLSHLDFSPGPDSLEAQLKFVAMINLAASDNCDISAGGGFRIVGKIEELPNDKQKWRFDRLKVDMIQVAYVTEGLEIAGQVIFFEDHVGTGGEPSYGDGFQGTFVMKLGGLKDDSGGGISIAAMGIFGTVPTAPGDGDNDGDNYKYWLVDALLTSDDGIPMGAVALHGIGGGAYFRMSQQNLTNGIVPGEDPEVQYADTTNVSNNASYDQYIYSNLGMSLSGTVYQPNDEVGLGVNATVVLATDGSPEAFNTTINFNIEWNNTGGLNHIRLGGTANFNAPITWSGPACEGTSLAINMEYIFEGSTTANGQREGFYASAHVFVNIDAVQGGLNNSDIPVEYQSLIVDNCGSLSNIKYAGGMEMQISPATETEESYWFVNIGTPDQPITLGVALLGDSPNMTLTAYLDIGQNVPAFPGLPDNVAELTQLGNIQRNDNALASGTGFAFGVSGNVGFSGEFLIFRASLGLGVGFDLMFLKYEDAPICVNNNNQELGFKSWYAMGQAWAYVDGSVDVGWRNSWYNIFDLSLAAAIQMKGPNPTYGRGAVGGRYRILGGLVKGNCHFSFEFGEECELPGDGELEVGIPLIASVYPSDSDIGVSVDFEPIVEFEFALGESFPVINPETNTATEHTYTVDIIELKLNGTVVEAEVNELGTHGMVITPKDMLQPNTEYELVLKATPYDENGNPLSPDEKSQSFTTGAGFPTVPLSNIAGGSPGPGQFNYYPLDNLMTGEVNTIKLKQGQDELLNNPPDGYLAKIKLTKTHPRDTIYRNFTYDSADNTISYNVVPSNFQNGFNYRLDVVHISEGVWNDLYPGGEDSETNDSQTGSVDFPTNPVSVLAASALNNFGFLKDEIKNLNEKATGSDRYFSSKKLVSEENFSLPLSDNPNASFPEPMEGEVSLLTYYFRVSQYNTFQEKMENVVVGEMEQILDTTFNVFNHSSAGYVEQALILGLEEPFGIEELSGIQDTPPTINVEADLNNTDWMNNVTDYIGIHSDEPAANLYASGLGNNYSCDFLDDLNYSIPNGENRSVLGEVFPNKAVSVMHPQIEEFLVTEDKALSWNNMAQEGNLIPTDLPGEPASIVYYVHNVVRNDVNKFRFNTFFEVSGYGEAASYLIPEDCEDVLDFASNHESYNACKDGFEDYESGNSSTIFELAPCCNIPQYYDCISDQLSVALENPCVRVFWGIVPTDGNCHTLGAVGLAPYISPGNFPVEFKYQRESGAVIYEESFNLINN